MVTDKFSLAWEAILLPEVTAIAAASPLPTFIDVPLEEVELPETRTHLKRGLIILAVPAPN